jgi:hypothetical protein|uniref:Uncharacterized protein n=1 Tax=viral metagenome TaxID=1070528 RepID=A0A6C0DYM2_9ZZZZ
MASPWTNDENPPRKRQSSIRKTIKIRPANAGNNESDHGDDKSEYMIHNLEDVEQTTENRTNRVNEIIHKLSSVSTDNDGAKLADFTPPPNPAIQMRKELPQERGGDPPITNLTNPLQMPAPSFSKRTVNPYTVNNASNIALGNYQQVYTPKMTVVDKPYYASMGISNESGGGGNKVVEKLNYMIHLLENMEGEKTANITEEFVLYTFLGVFVIFVVDSFTRTGKYVR